MKEGILQLLPNIGLIGGTAAKVKLLAERSRFRHIICYAPNPKNELYREAWSNIGSTTLIEEYSLSNPLKNALMINRICKQYDCCVVHTYFPIDSVSAAIAKLLNPRLQIVRSFEGAINYSNFKKTLQRLSFTLHMRFIAISKYIESFYLDMFHNSVKPISIIYNSPAFEHGHEGIFKHIGSDYNLLSVGGLNPTKNTETLIKAVHILKQRGENVKYHVLGDGPLRGKVQKMINNFGLENNVILHGYRTDVERFYKECSLYVHPANLEGFGMAVVEAMSYMCPVLVADSCALPELIVDGESGFILPTYDAVAWADKIECILSDQEKINALGQAAYQRYMDCFSIDNYVNSLDQLYDEILKQQP